MSAGTRHVTRLLKGAALASIVVSLLPLAARHWWLAELFSHFHVQYAAGQLALVLGLLALKQRLWSVCLLPFLLGNLALTWRYVWPSRAVGAGDADLKLMTVNLRASNRSFDSLGEMIETEAPGLILIIEYTPAAAAGLGPALSRYPHRFELAQADPFGLALFSQYALERAELFELVSTAAIDATVEGPAGSFRLLGVHLLPPTSREWSRARNAQLTRLAEVYAETEGPGIVMGDFNVSPHSPFFRDWLAASGLRDSLAGRGLTYTWPTQWPILGVTIDHCAVSEEFTVLARRHLADFGSDHRPVVVELAEAKTP